VFLRDNEMRLFRLLILFLGLIAVNACILDEDDPPAERDFIYPLEPGNIWKYERDYSLYFYTDTTNPTPYLDTLMETSQITNTVTGTDLLNDTLNAIEMICTENDGKNVYTNYQYYQNKTDGLYLLAYYSEGSLILPKSASVKHIRFKDMVFDNYHQLLNYIQKEIPIGKVIADSLYFENPPVKVLEYPLEIGAQWTYRTLPNDPFHIEKIIEGKESLLLNDILYDCYKVRFLYDLDHDGAWDEDIWITDYIGREGLIRRSITILGLFETSSTQPGGTGRFFDSFDTYTLTEFNNS